jgi:hypothetical protein
VSRHLAAVDLKVAEQKRLEEARAKVGDMLRQARELAQADLLAAESKIAEMEAVARAEGVRLSAEQAASARSILAMVDAEYGVGRRLQNDVPARLGASGERYEAGGEYGKALKVYEFAAAEGMEAAEDRIAPARGMSAQQARAAQDILGVLAGADEDLKQGRIEEALATVRNAMTLAREQGLPGPHMATVLGKCKVWLEEDMPRAIEAERPAIQRTAESLLATARDDMAMALAVFYLANHSPDLAEPYLTRLAEGSPYDAAYGARARELLERIDERKEVAEAARILEVKPETERALELAKELERVVSTGDLEDAKRAREELERARVELATARARQALKRGAYMEAVEIAGGLPGMPLSGSINRLAGTAARLQRAEQAIPQAEFGKAGTLLAQADTSGPEAAALQIKKNALAAVLDGIQEKAAQQQRFASMKEALLSDIQDGLVTSRLREDAWAAYFGAMKSIAAGETQQGASALRDVRGSSPAGLRDFELDHAQYVLATLSPQDAPGAAQATRMLAEAQECFDARDYVTAAALLDGVRATGRFAGDAEFRQDVVSLETAIAAEESTAAELYAEALKAREEDDKARVGEIVLRLRREYGKTKFYAAHSGE